VESGQVVPDWVKAVSWSADDRRIRELRAGDVNEVDEDEEG
jgi:hypothetical protein